jgi:hypothetical protein
MKDYDRTLDELRWSTFLHIEYRPLDRLMLDLDAHNYLSSCVICLIPPLYPRYHPKKESVVPKSSIIYHLLQLVLLSAFTTCSISASDGPSAQGSLTRWLHYSKDNVVSSARMLSSQRQITDCSSLDSLHQSFLLSPSPRVMLVPSYTITGKNAFLVTKPLHSSWTLLRARRLRIECTSYSRCLILTSQDPLTDLQEP